MRFDYNPLNMRVPDADSVTAFNDLLDTKGMSPWSAIVLTPDREAADAAARKLAILEGTALFMAPPPRSDTGESPTSDAGNVEALQRFVAAPNDAIPPDLPGARRPA